MYYILILLVAISSTEGFITSAFNTFLNCTKNEFLCKNGQCILEMKRCDGEFDCLDFSDEANCEMVHCEAPDFFRCRNLRCLTSAFICDGENDCGDFSDEENCKEFNIPQINSTCKDQWQCSDKLCIPQDWVCNGEPDCLDGSDEILGCSLHIDCDGFKCNNGHCIIKEWTCDGQDDCRDNSDEMGCDHKVSPELCNSDIQRFLCKDGKTCIELKNTCDKKFHCPDKSDEGPLCDLSCKNHSCSHQCIQLPKGPTCVCPEGYHNINENQCQDINECEIFGICDQKCKNTPGSYECFCDDNFILQTDNKSCKVRFGEAVMIFSSKTEIRAYALKSELYFSVSKNLKQVVGVDFDGKFVYWSDIFSEHESIVRSHKDGTHREILVSSGLGTPEDLHVDFITGNIYFTDAERHHIGVCTNDGTHCSIIVNKDVNKPRGIVLNPDEGEMYWTDWGKNPEIARSLMDGSQDTSFVSNDIHWPNGLTIDSPNSRLYWTDAKLMTLESISLDGTDRRIILEGVVKHPYAIAVFENRLYWSDWATHSIQTCDKFTGKNHYTLIREKKDYIYGISIFHENMHKFTKGNPCSSSFCSDICLLKGSNGYTCACPQDKELSLDQHTCKESQKKQKLILGTGNMLIHVEHKLLGKHDITTLPMTKVNNIGSLTYNSINNTLYISDLDTRKIVVFDLYSQISTYLDVKDVGQLIAMDYDYLGNNLYWCDSERNTVEVFNLNTFSRKIILHDMRGESPKSIALIPDEGVMFIAFQKLKKQEYHIDRFNMDGTGRTHILETGLLGPLSLTYDNDLHRVFIADAGTGNIESTSVEGDDRHGFRSLQSSPVGITSLKSEIFWVNEGTKTIYWAEKLNSDQNGYNKKITLDVDVPNVQMHIISLTSRKVGISPCQQNNGNCSHLCLHSQQTILCACPVGMILDNNNQTCIQRKECDSHSFFCSKTNTCILNHLRCDGFKNCFYGEDEIGCKAVNQCPLDTFKCSDEECIPSIYRCNKHFDCKDKSDELNCSEIGTQQCPPMHFKCNSGQCIIERFVCDGVVDCDDEEDENNCLSTTCSEFEFRCLSGACIPKYWECDHEYDCPDFSDEHMQCAACSSLMFTCNNGKCIDKAFMCDNENDCGDDSDEISCHQNIKSCNKDQISCSTDTSICLPLSARCNGTSECPHHEDEQHCSDCHVEEFTCDNKKCIPTQWVCDNSDDCGDKSDERKELCLHSLTAHTPLQTLCNNEFQCKNGNCIDFSLVCNGEPNCYDGSDEDGVCNTACRQVNNPCLDICQNTPSGPLCRCKPGLILLGDGKTCEDINECDSSESVCSQICHNDPGSYHCDCYDGFILRNDKTSCKAKDTAMSMVFTYENQIREASQQDNTLKLVFAEDTPKITGLDVDVSSEYIYFTIENAGTIHRINKNTKVREYMDQVGQPRKMAIDWITKNVYFVNNGITSKSISICNFNKKNCAKLISLDIHQQVSALAIDAHNKLLFYSLVSWWMFNSPTYIIYKANLDGSEVHELVKSTSGYITGLTYDLYKKELFYVDQHKGQLEKMNYDGTGNILISSNLTRPMGLQFFENNLYFFTAGGLMGKCRLYAPKSCTNFKMHSHSAELFALNQKSLQPYSNNLCKSNHCSHLCVPSQSKYKCLCNDGTLVTKDEECLLNRQSTKNTYKTGPVYHQEDPHSSSIGSLTAGLMIAMCLLTFSAVLYYLFKKRTAGSFDINMRFNKSGYGTHKDEVEESVLQPGKHEYTNPVNFLKSKMVNNENPIVLDV